MAFRWTLFALCISALYTKCAQYESHDDGNRGQSGSYSVENAVDSNFVDSLSQIFQLFASNKNQSPIKKYSSDNRHHRSVDRYNDRDDGRQERQNNHRSPQRYENDRYNNYDRNRANSDRKYRPYHSNSRDKYRNNRHRQYYQSEDNRQDGSDRRPYKQNRPEYRPNRDRYQRRPDNRNQHECKQCNKREQRHNNNDRAQQQSYKQNQQDRYQDQQNRYCSKCQKQNRHQSNNRYQPRDEYQQQNRYNQDLQYRDNQHSNRYRSQSNRYNQNRYQQNRYQKNRDTDYASYGDSRDDVIISNNYEHKSRTLQILLRTVEKLKCDEQDNCINKCADTSDPEACQAGCEREYECKRDSDDKKALRCDTTTTTPGPSTPGPSTPGPSTPGPSTPSDDCDTTWDPCAPSDEEITTKTTKKTTTGGSTRGETIAPDPNKNCRCRRHFYY